MKRKIWGIFKVLFWFFFIVVMVIMSVFGFLPSKNKYMNLPKDLLAERLERHVKFMSHEVGDRNVFELENLRKTENYIENEFKDMGYSPLNQYYEVVYDIKVRNIYVIKKGKKYPEKYIVVGAHYDTCLNCGADDNASGVAGVLELARIFKDIETKKSFIFVAFVNEEPPFFKSKDMGSFYFAKKMKDEKKDVEVAVILEMIGYYSNKRKSQLYPPLFGFFYPNKGNFIAIVGSSDNKNVIKFFKNSFRKHSDFPVASFSGPVFIPGIDYSDNWAFYKNGFKSFMFTDTAFFRNKNYHKFSDTYDTLNYSCMSEVVKTISKTLIDFDNSGC